MNSKRVAIGIGIALAVLVAFTTSASAGATAYFYNPDDPNNPGDPINVNLELGEIVTIQIMGDVDESTSGLKGYQVGVDYDPSVINITFSQPAIMAPYAYWWSQFFGGSYWSDETAPFGAYIWVVGTQGSNPDCYTKTSNPPLPAPLANLTIECVGAGTSPLIFTHEIRYPDSTLGSSRLADCGGRIPNETITWCNDVISGGTPETFTTSLALGWNLISLPLTPDDSSTSAVLDSISGNYSTVQKYVPGAGFEDATTMEPGIGYFIDMTAADILSYDGIAYESMSVPLSQGLNCVGWTNTSADIPGGALASIAGDYRYVSRWNTAEQKYEVYDAMAPPGVPEFIDFTTMERGVGYFIAATDSCTLTYP